MSKVLSRQRTWLSGLSIEGGIAAKIHTGEARSTRGTGAEMPESVERRAVRTHAARIASRGTKVKQNALRQALFMDLGMVMNQSLLWWE